MRVYRLFRPNRLLSSIFYSLQMNGFKGILSNRDNVYSFFYNPNKSPWIRDFQIAGFFGLWNIVSVLEKSFPNKYKNGNH